MPCPDARLLPAAGSVTRTGDSYHHSMLRGLWGISPYQDIKHRPHIFNHIWYKVTNSVKGIQGLLGTHLYHVKTHTIRCDTPPWRQVPQNPNITFPDKWLKHGTSPLHQDTHGQRVSGLRLVPRRQGTKVPTGAAT